MIQDVRTGEELNERGLKQFLHQNKLLSDVRSHLEVKQFSNGFSNLTYLLGFEEKEVVLRRAPKGAVKRGHDMGREYKVLSRLYKAFPKAPKALAFTSSEEVIGAPFYLMEKVDGIILTAKEANKRQIKPRDFSIISDRWLDTFVELHQVDYRQARLGDLGKPEGYVERQVDNWGKQFLNAATREVPAAHKVMRWLEEHQPRVYTHSLIHNDFKYDNIVFADAAWKEVRAVLDWEMCTLGDPMMDLGTSLAYWSMATDGEMVQKGLPSPTLMPGNPSRSEIVEGYARKSGQPMNHLVFYYAFGLFKIAEIAQQIFYRYKKGLTTDERFARLDKSAEFLCTMALQAIQKNQIEDLF